VLDRVAATILRHRMLPPGSNVIVAVSGGPDSVGLLHILRELAPRLGIAVAGVAHVNHKLRGAESDGDEQFVAELAQARELPFFSAEIRAGRGNLEQFLRRERREFFTGLIRKGQATHVALGHTRDDQAETVLLRILRGSGLAGIAGILPAAADGIVRPLLDVGRQELQEYLLRQQIGWRVDSSNIDPRFARNRIRNGLLPQLRREWNPRISEALAQMAALAYEEEQWWAEQVSKVNPVRGAEAEAAAIAALPAALARRVVRQIIRNALGDLRRIEFAHVDAVLKLARARAGSGRVDLPRLTVIRSFDRLRFGHPLPPLPPRSVSVPGKYLSPGGDSSIVIELSRRRTCANLKNEISWRKLPDRLELRGWVSGDSYRPLGESRERKLKEMFQDARVPSWRRASWPILSSEGRILWAKWFGVAAEFAAEARGKVVRVLQTPLPESTT
jgi:tRNA(Ile)-lysidine synthase